MNLAIVQERPAQQAPTPTATARCADGNGTLTGLFFSHDDLDIARAKAICRTCAHAVECLDGALDRVEYYGVWGGTLLVEGQPVRYPPRRGRPSTAPRLEFVDDPVRIPDHLVA